MAYWRRFSYAKVVERVEALFPDLNIAELREGFLNEVPRTLVEEAAEEEALVEEPSNQVAAEVPTTVAVGPQSPAL